MVLAQLIKESILILSIKDKLKISKNWNTTQRSLNIGESELKNLNMAWSQRDRYMRVHCMYY